MKNEKLFQKPGGYLELREQVKAAIDDGLAYFRTIVTVEMDDTDSFLLRHNKQEILRYLTWTNQRHVVDYCLRPGGGLDVVIEVRF